jgi:hypothetical protein
VNHLPRLPAVGDNAAMEAEPPKADPPKRKRRWLQFSLRTLMMFTLICAVAAGWLGKRMEQKRSERDAAEAITKIGGQVVYDYPSQSAPAAKFACSGCPRSGIIGKSSKARGNPSRLIDEHLYANARGFTEPLPNLWQRCDGEPIVPVRRLPMSKLWQPSLEPSRWGSAAMPLAIVDEANSRCR